MSEQVIRHRGVQRDEDGRITDPSSPDAALTAICVAPGSGGTSAGTSGGADRLERGRSGEDTQCVVYFPAGTDIKNSDELTVRNERYRIVVNNWFVGRGGLEVVCTRGQG